MFIRYTTFSKNGDVTIRPSSKVFEIVNEMYEKKYITFTGKEILKVLISKKMQPGVFEFHYGENIFEFADKISKGISKFCSFTFVPGYTIYQYIQILNDDDNFSGKVSVKLTDGSILPDTYTYKCQTPKDVVLLYGKKKMDDFLENLKIDYSNSFVKNDNELLTLASIIEKETSLESERKLVASVFKNRLKVGMRLQTDPTVIYQQSNGMGFLGRPISSEDLKQDGPYNTYKINGLPPHPISNPSKQSILSAIDNYESDMFYFVAKSDVISDGHNFSKTYKEHLENVKKYRKSLGSNGL